MDWQTILSIICATGIPSVAFSIIISRILKSRDEHGNEERLREANAERREKAIQNGVCALLRIELRDMHSDFIKQGEITAQDYELFINAYKPYHDLGGNDIATAYLEDVKNLPIKDK